MSRGLSVHQKAILKVVEENGSINILTASRLFHGVNKVLEGKDPKEIYDINTVMEKYGKASFRTANVVLTYEGSHVGYN